MKSDVLMVLNLPYVYWQDQTKTS